jgi:hypothetical protein
MQINLLSTRTTEVIFNLTFITIVAIINAGVSMIPIKNFKHKVPQLAKEAALLNKRATLVKNFKMPFIQIIANKPSIKKVKK